MRTKLSLSIIALLLMASLSASGQDQPASGAADPKGQQSSSAQQGSSDQTAEGIEKGNWRIEQSTELGYRWEGINGNEGMYNSLVNVHQGLRLLDQVLGMHSLNHTGVLFDDLYISSFGWGGEPNNAARWSVSKNKAYSFTGNFRRDQNFFDYDLLANPLNPLPTGTPGLPNANVNVSPHTFELRRRMSDMALTIAPQAPVSIRLGYMRNNMTGPSFSSFHEGTDVLLQQLWNTTLNGYRIGVDFKVLPKTIISFDENLQYFKNDTDWSLAFFPINPVTGAPFATATGIPVAFGLPWNVPAPARQPCAAPFTPAGSTIVNPTCNVYQSYTRFQRYRSKQPTEQLTFQSRGIRKLDFVASGSYSSADMNDPINENFVGVVTRTNERAFTITGPAKARSISANVDLGATYHFTDTWRVNFDFRFWRFNNPGSWDSSTASFSPVGAATVGGPIGTATVTPDLLEVFFGQSAKYLTGEIEHDFTKAFGARIGTRWTNRHINHRDFAEDEADITDINEYTGLIGLWLHTVKGFRANVDAEFSSADNFLVRIGPRNQQRYRARVSYNPKPWALVSGYLNFWEARNGDAAIRYEGHNRNGGITLNVTPNDRYGIDLGYNFNAFLQNSNVCFFGATGTLSPPGTITSTDPACIDALTTATTTALEILGSYRDRVHFFSTSFYVRPVKRVTLNLGYGLDHSSGDVTRFNALQPLGPLHSNYHQPLANLGIEVVHRLTWNLGWNYWNYHEDDIGPTLPRNFHSNVGTVSLKYAF